MATFLDLTGKRFGRLTVIGLHTERNNWGKFRWVCKCDCGRISYPITVSLTSGITKTCGNYCVNQWDTTRKRGRKPKHPDYSVWMNMKMRCYDKGSISYVNYGARGIKVCKRWENSFLNFISDMGKRPSKQHSLDRIDNDGDYKPSNCRWAIPKVQAYNRRTTVWITTDNGKYTTLDFCKLMGFDKFHLKFLIKKRKLSGQQIIDLYKIKPYKKRQKLSFAKQLMLKN